MEDADHQSHPDALPPNGDGAEIPAADAARRVGWETGVRCFFLLAALSLLGFLSWQPALLRFNALASLANPSRGESLAWKADGEPAPPLPEVRRTRPPGEWRLTSAFSADWLAERPAAKGGAFRAGALSRISWRRHSANPWSWRDDVVRARRLSDAVDAMQPPQKPATSFRAGNIASFPEPEPALAQAVPTFPGLAPANPAFSAPPQLPPLNREPALPTILPALPARPDAGIPERDEPARPAAADPVGTLRPPTPTPSVPAPPTAPAEIDWRNREITGPIPDAYLTIYPKLKFIGLCVPGQGYIRKYNQVGVPADVENPKISAQDGRTPYGRYYIADRNRDADGPRLFLSWPSPEDAVRIGLSPAEDAAVADAWRRQGLPPQNTRAGGGIAINGLRQWVETTEGGFTLEEPHMEEIFTALPDRAWVFIQP